MIQSSGVHPPNKTKPTDFDYQKAAWEVLKLIDSMVVNRLEDKKGERCSVFAFIGEDFTPTFTLQGTWGKEHWKSFVHSMLYFCQMTKGKEFLYEVLASFNDEAKEAQRKLWAHMKED